MDKATFELQWNKHSEVLTHEMMTLNWGCFNLFPEFAWVTESIHPTLPIGPYCLHLSSYQVTNLILSYKFSTTNTCQNVCTRMKFHNNNIGTRSILPRLGVGANQDRAWPRRFGRRNLRFSRSVVKLSRNSYLYTTKNVTHTGWSQFRTSHLRVVARRYSINTYCDQKWFTVEVPTETYDGLTRLI